MEGKSGATAHDAPKKDNGDDSSSDNDTSRSGSSSTSDDVSGREPEDSDMEKLLQALSETSSDEEDNPVLPRPKPEGTNQERPNFMGRHDGLASNIAVLMVACWTMRLPVMYIDFIKCVIPCPQARHDRGGNYRRHILSYLLV